MPQRRFIGPSLIFASIAISVIGTLGAPLVPTIARDEHVSLELAQWIFTTPPLVAALATPVLGRLGDGARRDRVLHGTLAMTCLGCVVTAAGPSFAWLIAGRALQGVGLAALALTVALAREHLAGARQEHTIRWIAVGSGAGAALGFPATALAAQELGFRGAFWLAAVVIGAMLAFVWAAVPRSPRGTRSVPLDLPGAALLGFGLVGILLAISRANTWGWGSPQTLVLAGGGLVLLAIWVVVELRIEHPLIDLRLARIPALLVANVGGMAIMFGMYGGVSLINRLTQTPTSVAYGLGGSIVLAGVILAPMGAATVASMPFTRLLASRVGIQGVLPIGAATAAATYFALAAIGDRTAVELALASGLVGLAIGWTFAVIPSIIVAHVPPERTGSAMSLHQVLRGTGAAAGSAVSITILGAYVPIGAGYPTEEGYVVAFLVAGLACGVSAIAAAIVLPRTRRQPAQHAATPSAESLVGPG